MSILNLIRLQNVSIFEQLQLEEALLRIDDRNWVIINYGASPTIVMGISAKIEQVIDQRQYQTNPIPIVRRFSGGGTVVVDQHTFFITLIGNKTLASLDCSCPSKLLKWTESLYSKAFEPLPFKLLENDYVLHDKKFGGNAQYLMKDRWLHHSSLLWNFSAEKMNYLCFPPKVPQYRVDRSHVDFLCSLNSFFPTLQTLENKMIANLSDHFVLKEISLDEIAPILHLPHRKATELI